MKPYRIEGNLPANLGPCDIDAVMWEKPVCLHPKIAKTRNKRQRHRMMKKLKKMGVEAYLTTGWMIYPLP